jgi:FkbM family methyltransferase
MGHSRYQFVFAILTIRRIPFSKSYKDFRFFLHLIPEEGTLLDIGANIGLTAITLAKRFPKSQVLAFEPVPENLTTLEKVIRYYGMQNIQVFATALGNTQGFLTMQVPEINGSRMQGLSRVIENENGPVEQSGLTYQVPVQMLDRFTEIQTAKKITAIKMDVENYEYFVLSGAKEVIRKHQPLLFCELWNNERRMLCIQLLATLDYHCYVLQHNQLIPYQGQDSLNFFFLPYLLS